jgi:ATP-dependent DNA ligase
MNEPVPFSDLYKMLPALTDYDQDKHRGSAFYGVAQPKLNGVFGCYHTDVCRLMSRNGKLWAQEKLAHITKALSKLKLPEAIGICGELYRHGWPLQRINGAVSINSQMPGIDTAQIEFHVFDYIPRPNIANPLPNLRRIMLLSRLVEELQSPVVIPVHYTHSINCHKQLTSVFNAYTSSGYEGLVLRNENTYYVAGTTPTIVRWKKPNKTLEGIVRSITIGNEGKYENTLGAMVVAFENPVTKEQGVVSLGSGYTDPERNLIWKNPSNYVGKTVLFKYETLSEGGIPLKPIFDCFKDMI